MVVVDPQIRVESQRLLLRPLVMDDAAAIRLIRSDPETMLHT
jgi:RimJ/RimL family protein N-acetyltransferase